MRLYTSLRESSPWKMSEVKLDLNAIALDLLDFCGGDPRKLDKAIHGGAFIKNYKPDQIKEIVGKASIIVQIAREFAEEGADDEFAESSNEDKKNISYIVDLLDKHKIEHTDTDDQKRTHSYFIKIKLESSQTSDMNKILNDPKIDKLIKSEQLRYSRGSAFGYGSDARVFIYYYEEALKESSKLQESAFVVDEGGDDLDIQEYTNELKKLGFSFAGGIMWQKRVEKNDKVMYLKIAVQVGSDAGYRIEYSVDSQPLSARKGGGPYRPDPEAKKIEALLKKSPYTQTNDDHYDMSYDQIFGMNKQDAVKFLVNTAKAAIKIVESKI